MVKKRLMKSHKTHLLKETAQNNMFTVAQTVENMLYLSFSSAVLAAFRSASFVS